MADYKFFCVATEGATTDGREITRADIVNMAETYDFATHAARVNVEHIKGVAPSGEFGSYGDVLALKTGDVTVQVGGKPQKRLGLFAQIKPLDNLKSLTAAGQKLYTSIEINPNFAKSGKAYLMGVAATDNPAALGVEVLKFSAGNPAASPFTARKSDPSCLFTAAQEVNLDFSESLAPVLPENSDASGLLAFFKQLLNFSGQQPAPVAPVAPVTPETPPANTPALSFAADPMAAAMFSTLLSQVEKGQAQIAALTQSFAASEAKVAELRTQLESEPSRNFSHRPRATGADDVERADC
ncbi:GPO family capsid scaffolding protein [Novosphingobium sp. KACC 22771]|uniref:GPO family capsid scaffolding protein n=1 Tax=Novosphingobium sp. KACC 22771 TaxID=3025670 RepID=UPI0023653B05|nr:GPO family capsid scaffolding protein [Novosphingobium sp. KACC 22771]WDF71462.1 GPO family capsid scaffolding protein [Novosphingobium sp. KACC 22771]